MIPNPAEDLAAFIWPNATPEQIQLLAGALSRAFQKLKPSTGAGLQTICKKTQK